jgi:hypothetical protein
MGGISQLEHSDLYYFMKNRDIELTHEEQDIILELSREYCSWYSLSKNPSQPIPHGINKSQKNVLFSRHPAYNKTP